VLLSVADHGAGIPAAMRDEVIKRFVRLDESRSKPGTGLGLSLVEAVMEMHHGALHLADTVPSAEDGAKGLTVQMVFPMTAT
jgi:signal transduction histidine kinase